MTLDPSELAVVRRTIEAYFAGSRTDNTGLTRQGTVESYTPSNRTAMVVVDGDPYSVSIANRTNEVLNAGERVTIEFQEPSGAAIVALAGAASFVGAALFGTIGIPNGGAGPVSLSGLEVFLDTHGYWDVDAGQIVVPASLQGIYGITIVARTPGIIPTRFYAGWIKATNPTYYRGNNGTTEDSASKGFTLATAAGDVWTPEVYQISGADRNVDIELEFILLKLTT